MGPHCPCPAPLGPPLHHTHGSGPHFGPCPSDAMGSWSPALPQPGLICMLTSWPGLGPFPSPRPCPAIVGLCLILVPCTRPEPDPRLWGYVLAWPCPVPIPREVSDGWGCPQASLVPGWGGRTGPGGQALPCQPRGPPDAPGLRRALAHVASSLPTTTVRRLSPFQLLRKINPQKSSAKGNTKDFYDSCFMIFHQEHKDPF